MKLLRFAPGRFTYPATPLSPTTVATHLLSRLLSSYPHRRKLASSNEELERATKELARREGVIAALTRDKDAAVAAMLAARQAATKAAAEGKAGGQQNRVDVAKVGCGWWEVHRMYGGHLELIQHISSVLNALQGTCCRIHLTGDQQYC